MNQETKTLLKITINNFLTIADEKKEEIIESIEINLENAKHELKLNDSIDYYRHKRKKLRQETLNYIQASKIFLRIYKKENTKTINYEYR